MKTMQLVISIICFITIIGASGCVVVPAGHHRHGGVIVPVVPVPAPVPVPVPVPR